MSPLTNPREGAAEQGAAAASSGRGMVAFWRRQLMRSDGGQRCLAQLSHESRRVYGMRSAPWLLAGVLLGVAGHAAYRGDLPWQRPAPQVTAEPAAEQPKALPVPAAALLPELPISLSVRESAKGRGSIVQFHNTSQKQRAVLVELKNPTLNHYRAAPIQLGSGELREIGEAQGWAFASGETITVREDGHRPRSLTIP